MKIETFERNHALCDLFKEGLSLEALAEKYEISEQRVRQILIENKLIKTQPKRRLKDQFLLDLNEAKLSPKEMKEKYGEAYYNKQLFYQVGIDKKELRLKAIDILYDSGFNKNELAALFDVTPVTVNTIIKTADLKKQT